MTSNSGIRLPYSFPLDVYGGARDIEKSLLPGDRELFVLIKEELPDSLSAYYSEINLTGKYTLRGFLEFIALLGRLRNISTTGLKPLGYIRCN